MVRQIHHHHPDIRSSTSSTTTTTTFAVHERIPSIPSIPGFKTSAAFLTSLSANLRLPDELPSPISTPPSLAHSTDFGHPLPPPSPLAFASMPPSDPPFSPLSGIPDLVIGPSASENDRIDGLKLVVDSVAEMKGTAAKLLLAHWVTWAGMVVVYSVVGKVLWKSSGDVPLVLTTCAGATMALFVLIRYFTAEYVALAEGMDFEWIGGDEILVARFGERVVGALVLGMVAEGGKGRRKKAVRGEIRAWTVRRRYRGKGVGTGLLEEAVKLVEARGGEGVGFSAAHANSHRVLYDYFDKPLDEADARAERKLQDVIYEQNAFAKKNRRGS